jgi:hypothetical protein
VIRRTLAIAAAIGGLASLTACSTVDKPAATVNGVAIPMAEFVDELDALGKTEIGTQGIGLLIDPDNPEYSPADGARSWLQLRIVDELAKQVADESGEALPASEIEAQRATFESSAGWADLPAPVQASILNVVVGGAVRQEDIRAAMRSADIDVASTLGRWDPDTAQIVPAGS